MVIQGIKHSTIAIADQTITTGLWNDVHTVSGMTCEGNLDLIGHLLPIGSNSWDIGASLGDYLRNIHMVGDIYVRSSTNPTTRYLMIDQGVNYSLFKSIFTPIKIDSADDIILTSDNNLIRPDVTNILDFGSKTYSFATAFVNYLWIYNNTGAIYFGSGINWDCKIERIGGANLLIDSWLDISDASGNSYNIGISETAPEIYFGDRSSTYDVNLYRSAANTLKTDDKLTVVGGVDPPYVSYSGETHKSILKFAETVEGHEEVMQFWNKETERFEYYHLKKKKFYTMDGKLIEE